VSRNLDRALEAIDEVLGHEGQSSPEHGYGVDRPGSCWRCLARDAEGDAELCAPCAAYLKGDTDEEPDAPARFPGVNVADLIARRRIPHGIRYHAVMDERGEIATPRGVRVTDVVAHWGTPPSEGLRHRFVEGPALVYSIQPVIPTALRPAAREAADREQAIATLARVFEVDREALESFAEGIRRIGVAAEEAMAAIRHVFETTAESLRETFEAFAEELVEDAAERSRARNREAIARYRRDPRRTLGPDLRATEAPRRPPHPNPRRRS